jgi:endogenous inhibitor of DNA gyrase (YacG/DUF329 family)
MPATEQTLANGHRDVNATGPGRPAVDTAQARGYDGAVNPSGSASARRARCPRCGTAVAWAGNPNRPFCSLTCRLIDLGAWLDERYRIPGPELPDEWAPDESPPDKRVSSRS